MQHANVRLGEHALGNSIQVFKKIVVAVAVQFTKRGAYVLSINLAY